jgi:hypothetical protein
LSSEAWPRKPVVEFRTGGEERFGVGTHQGPDPA